MMFNVSTSWNCTERCIHCLRLNLSIPPLLHLLTWVFYCVMIALDFLISLRYCLCSGVGNPFAMPLGLFLVYFLHNYLYWKIFFFFQCRLWHQDPSCLRLLYVSGELLTQTIWSLQKLLEFLDFLLLDACVGFCSRCARKYFKSAGYIISILSFSLFRFL